MTQNEFRNSIKTKITELINECRNMPEINILLLEKQGMEATAIANQMMQLDGCHQGQLRSANEYVLAAKSIAEMKKTLSCCSYIIEKGYSLQKMFNRVLLRSTNWEHICCFKEMIEVREKLGYKKVRYPEGLHNLYKEKLKFDYRLTEDLYASDKIEKRYEENSWMNREITVNNKTYLFMIPKNIHDIRKEAKQLHTHIASRCMEYADGKLTYVLMHKKTSPNNAYADIIINNNGFTLWAVTKNNKPLEGDDEKAFLEFMKQTDNAGTLR